MWGEFFELEQHNAKVAKGNHSERTCYQDRHNAILQRRTETHDNYVYPQHPDNIPEHAWGMERERL